MSQPSTAHSRLPENARSRTLLDLPIVQLATVMRHECPTCQGNGVIRTHRNYWGKQEDDTCARCAGTGQLRCAP